MIALKAEWDDDREPLEAMTEQELVESADFYAAEQRYHVHLCGHTCRGFHCLTTDARHPYCLGCQLLTWDGNS